MIDDFCRLFNRDAPNYKELVFDRLATEKKEITKPNDINQGALHNALEWHFRTGQNMALKMSLKEAKDYLVDLWAMFWAIERPANLSNDAFRIYLLTTVLGISPTIPVLEDLLPNATFRVAKDMGPYLDHAFLDVGVKKKAKHSSVLTHELNVVYIIFDNANYDSSSLLSIIQALPAGKGLLVGVENSL